MIQSLSRFPETHGHDGAVLTPSVDAAERVARLIDASPTPYHAVEQAAGMLASAGARVPSGSAEAASPGLWYHAEGGALAAWAVGDNHGARSGMRIVGAHTDSPNLRLKPRPDAGQGGAYRQLGVEVYGGALLNSWLDRDLGVAGRLAVRDGTGGVSPRLVRIDEPLLRIPQLAIHLDREVNEKGLVLNRQQHLSPIWSLDAQAAIGEATASLDAPPARRGARAFMDTVAEAAGVDPIDVVGHELMVFDVDRARFVGEGASMLSAARIDNLLSCFAAVDALVAAADAPGPRIAAVCLFDHEEVGSVSSTGAASPRLDRLVDRLASGFGADSDDAAAARADSIVLSADGAHATHPNYPERHDQQHPVILNGGPVLKSNANQRYATDALTGAAFRLACERAEVPMQLFVSRSDMASGSTIGPVTAGRSGMGTVDAGCAQLAMHSARELCGAHDIGWFRAAIEQFLLG